MYKSVYKNEFGYYVLKEQMPEAEKNEYYSKVYFQNSDVYTKQYTDQEIEYFNIKLEEKHIVINELQDNNKKENPEKFLDIGCGEGFALKYFSENGYKVTGIDYSSFGCEQHNPDMCEKILYGDITEKLNELINKQIKFNIINLDNVLEHLAEPAVTLEKCRQISYADTILCIKVPNDFSIVQQYLYDNNYVDNSFWVAIPDHVSYFNKDGLKRLAESTGWNCLKILGDTPIDFNLLNDNVNYIKNKSVGKSCYKAKVAIESLLHSISPEETLKLYEIMGNMGVGREIYGYLKII